MSANLLGAAAALPEASDVEIILDGYAQAAPRLVEAWEAIDPERLYAPVIDLFPLAPGRVLDISAGTGRDAAWLATMGHAVVAVEPVAALREAGRTLHAGAGAMIGWVDDRLPALAHAATSGLFDFVLLSGVWQHLDAPSRAMSMPRIARMMSAEAVLVLSLRHGPGFPGRPVFPVDPAETIAQAESAGLRCVRRVETGSLQPGNRALGVTWTWLGFRA